MSKLKKLSFILILVVALFAGFFGFNFKSNNISNLEAETEKIALTVKKIKYTNTNIKKDDNVKKLGEYTSRELYDNIDDILASTTEEENFVTSGDVVSIKPNENEAVLVYLAPSDNTAIIRQLSNASLSLTTKDNKSVTYQIESINKVENGGENKIAIVAFDFSSLTTALGTEFEYSDIGHFNFTFEYQYTTDGTNILTGKKIFEFYLIDNENYFSTTNKYKLENYLEKTENKEIYYYNHTTITALTKAKKEITLVFDPYKFMPTINYTYNETFVTLQTQFDSLTNSFKLISSNENIYESKTLTLNDNNKIELELDRIGKYDISYQLVIVENNNLNIIDKSKTEKLSELQDQTLYIFGYEALYKNYQEQNAEIKRLNQNYKRLYDKNFESDFSYIEDFFAKDADENLDVETIKNNVINYLSNTTNASVFDKIAKTNQAPIKINGFVTENVTGAKYYIINKDATSYNYTENNFSPSVRFEKEGLYVVIIPYKFETYTTNVFYKVFMFQIENSTPSLNFYTDENLTTPLNANGFTNQDVYCAWDKEENNPFSYPSKITFVRDGKVLTLETEDYNILSNDSKNYVKFEANENNNGLYLVQLTYGTNEVTVEKSFTIDTSEIEFCVVEVEKNDNSYTTKNNLDLTDSKTTTENNFAVFVKNKDVQNNTLSVNYDYIALDYKTAQNKYEIDESGKLLIYNNYQLNTIRKNLTYSNNAINNLTNLTNLIIEKNNTNAVISINALYKFTIKDLAGNEKVFFVLLDNTPSIVLESNSVVKVGNKDLIVGDTTIATVNEKDDSINLVSNNYSLIFGDFKAIEFLINSDNLDFAQTYFGDTNLETDQYKTITTEISALQISRQIISAHTEENIKTVENEIKNNIFSIDLSKNANNEEFNCIYTIENKSSLNQFELNTDKHQVLIFGKKDGVYTRIYQENPTNLDNVYITFKNEVNNDDYDLQDLQLDFYPITASDDGKITFPNNPTETYNLLNVKESGQIVCNGKSYGEFVINPLITTYKNGKYVAKEGKYIITKTLKNDTKTIQTFYVDRKSPISYFEDNQNILIGKNINITLDEKNLSAETIYNYLLNNTTLQTNMLNFVWTNSNGKNFVYKYENLNDENLKINFAIINSNKKLITDIKTTLTPGEYTLLIYDNTYFMSKQEDITLENILKTNYVELKISTNANKPQGYYVKNGNESLQTIKSTNTSSLSFEFEDSESEFAYNIDLNNIILKQNGKIIFRTTTENDASKTSWFNLGDKTVYYVSYIGNVFNLSRKQIGTTSRYKYTLTILDSTKNCEILFENGISREAVYDLELSYDYDKTKYSLLDGDGKNFGTNNFEMIIDHTAPNYNFSQYLQQDKFLSDEEKNELKNSFLNKDISNQINFDNYVLVVNSAPQNLDSTDTNLIYIRKYDKYQNENIENQQSLVIDDARYSDQTISKYRFDVNTYITNSDGTSKKLYTSKSYSNNETDFFVSGEGFYEIIEMDEAGNYSVYTVYYSATDLGLSASYTLSDEEETTTNSGEIELFDPNFKLTKINTTNFDYLDVKILINEKSENALNFNLKYLPFTVSSQSIEYVNTPSNLVNRINEIIKNYNTINEYGNVCKIIISNRNGTTLTITNSTPNKEFEIKDYIKNYDNNKIILTIPNSVENATYIKTLKVYPVVNGSKTSNPLEQDSNKNTISNELLNTQNYVYTFTDKAYVKDENGTITEQSGIKVYYFVWTDNFERTQNIVRYLGEKSEAKFTFEEDAQFVTKNGENYTQNSKNIYFEYNPDLYSIKIEYQLLPSTTNNEITLTNKTSSKLDLFAELKNSFKEITSSDLENSQIKFIVTLTDLTKLDEELQNKITYSYIYYPLMPKFEFTDSASNTLSIIANNDNIISTSKNVHFSYINDTLFNISLIEVSRTYLDSNNQTQIEKSNISAFEHTFSSLGNYTLVVTNELGKQEIYKFNITTATSKTYIVETNEDNMTNFELQSYGISEKIIIDGTEQTFETYYSIYKAKVIVNTDFNLSLEEIDCENDDGYSLYLIKKGNENFKYIAIKKVEYNSNFLNLKNENCSLQIVNVNDMNLTNNIQGYTLTTTEGIKVTFPLYNTNNVETESENNNKIVLKLYFNNQLIDLNANIYTIDSENAQQILEFNDVPSGIYSLYFEDIAGNIQLFNGNSFLNLSICKEIAIKINNEIPVDYQIYNSNVKLSILNEKQYISTKDKSLKIQAFLNNNELLNITKDENKNYIFTEYGFYKVIISGYLSSDGPEIKKTIFFTILNKNEAIKEFSFVSLNGQNISKILRDGKDVTNEIKQILACFPLYKNEDETYNQSQLEQLKLLLNTNFEKTYLYNINLKSEIEYTLSISQDEQENDIVNIGKYLAGGVYEIFVKTQNLILSEQNYSFNVWIRDKDAKININSTLEKNGETSKEITLSYNSYLIYTQIGECAIYVNNTIVAQIDSASSNAVSTYTIPRDSKGTFIVQVKSSSGNTELSFVLNKKEPLSTVSIIVIVVACLIVAGGIFLFIKLRTKMKVK